MSQKGLINCRVLENLRLSEKDFVLSFETETKVSARPGQFLMLSLSRHGSSDPLLNRPFSIFDAQNDSTYRILYRVVGRGTKALSELSRGDEFKALMPLGRAVGYLGEKVCFIAGGIGLGGVFWLAKETFLSGSDVFVLFGGRTADDLAARVFLEELGIASIYTTEDGSLGKEGLVIDALEEFLDWVWFACGPKGMLKAVREIALNNGVDCYLSLDTRMACGVGGCFGCVVKTPQGYKRVCKEGPVFKAQEVEL